MIDRESDSSNWSGMEPRPALDGSLPSLLHRSSDKKTRVHVGGSGGKLGGEEEEALGYYLFTLFNVQRSRRFVCEDVMGSEISRNNKVSGSDCLRVDSLFN